MKFRKLKSGHYQHGAYEIVKQMTHGKRYLWHISHDSGTADGRLGVCDADTLEQAKRTVAQLLVSKFKASHREPKAVGPTLGVERVSQPLTSAPDTGKSGIVATRIWSGGEHRVQLQVINAVGALQVLIEMTAAQAGRLAKDLALASELPE